VMNMQQQQQQQEQQRQQQPPTSSYGAGSWACTWTWCTSGNDKQGNEEVLGRALAQSSTDYATDSVANNDGAKLWTSEEEEAFLVHRQANTESTLPYLMEASSGMEETAPMWHSEGPAVDMDPRRRHYSKDFSDAFRSEPPFASDVPGSTEDWLKEQGCSRTCEGRIALILRANEHRQRVHKQSKIESPLPAFTDASSGMEKTVPMWHSESQADDLRSRRRGRFSKEQCATFRSEGASSASTRASDAADGMEDGSKEHCTLEGRVGLILRVDEHRRRATETSQLGPRGSLLHKGALSHKASITPATLASKHTFSRHVLGCEEEPDAEVGQMTDVLGRPILNYR